jgi:hypothetical protein
MLVRCSPISTKPNPSPSMGSTTSAFLSNPAATPAAQRRYGSQHMPGSLTAQQQHPQQRASEKARPALCWPRGAYLLRRDASLILLSSGTLSFYSPPPQSSGFPQGPHSGTDGKGSPWWSDSQGASACTRPRACSGSRAAHSGPPGGPQGPSVASSQPSISSISSISSSPAVSLPSWHLPWASLPRSHSLRTRLQPRLAGPLLALPRARPPHSRQAHR